jgi:hypothetical protein
MAIIALTTNNSISVKPPFRDRFSSGTVARKLINRTLFFSNDAICRRIFAVRVLSFTLALAVAIQIPRLPASFTASDETAARWFPLLCIARLTPVKKLSIEGLRIFYWTFATPQKTGPESRELQTEAFSI